MSSQLEEFFKITAYVHQGCLLSSILFNLFLEKIMHGTLHDNHTSISIGGRPICNLRSANNTDLVGSSSGELQDLTNRLVDRATAYRMEVCTEKTKIMTNSTHISSDISTNSQKLKVTSFKYLGATPCKGWHPAQQKSASGMPRQWPDYCHHAKFDITYIAPRKIPKLKFLIWLAGWPNTDH